MRRLELHGEAPPAVWRRPEVILLSHARPIGIHVKVSRNNWRVGRRSAPPATAQTHENESHEHEPRTPPRGDVVDEASPGPDLLALSWAGTASWVPCTAPRTPELRWRYQRYQSHSPRPRVHAHCRRRPCLHCRR